MLAILLALGTIGPGTLHVPDSASLVRTMRLAQSAFERQRRALLPITTAGLGRCDVRVGRFCYWYDPDEPPPRPEPAALAALRAGFIARLDSAARAVPGDPWLAGQRVRYLVEAGRAGEAVDAALACGEGWHCAALAGFAFHAGHQFAEADRAYRVALDGMPSADRCRWNDLSPVLERDDLRGYRGLDCAARDSANAALGWRAAPLHANGGADLRTEVYARHTLAMLLRDAANHHGERVGPDYVEVVLRYGWATAWGRRQPPPGSGAAPDVVGHEPRPAYPLLAWRPGRPLEPVERPRFRYAPRYLRGLREPEAVQVARFRRGDSLLVVAAWAAAGDSLLRVEAAAGAIVASSRDGAERQAAPIEGGSGVATVIMPATPHFVSLELGDSVNGGWLRYREWADVAPTTISELLLVRPEDEAEGAATLEAVLERAIAGPGVLRRSPVGLYWETYGDAGADQAVRIRLRVEPAGAGFLRRVGRSLGLAGERNRLELAWPVEGGPAPRVRPHFLEVDLSRLDRGRYVILVEAEAPDGTVHTAARVIRLL